VPFERLPETRQESERIGKLLGARSWLAAEARKDRLLECRSPRILHLALPVRFLPDPEPKVYRELELRIGSVLTNMVDLRSENPLDHSLLGLAGANTRPEAERVFASGVLTAREIAALDLLRTELVLLSCCESAAASDRSFRSLVGFQRSFLLAGSQSLILSLWKVPDLQKQELLENFYRRVLAGRPRAEALREAQLALKAKYPHPWQWGAFICLGNPKG